MYTPHTDNDIRAMLDAIGVGSLDDLLKVPDAVALKAPLEIVPALPEYQIARRFEHFASKNTGVDYTSFLGAGSYRHYAPPAIGTLAMRGEFLTAYTPYQAEVSQGYLQAIYEWQSYICLLTGMDIANASVYDGATALAEATIMALNVNGRKKVLVSRAIDPNYRAVLKTYCDGLDVEIDELGWTASGTTDLEALRHAAASKEYAAIALQSPNFFGNIDTFDAATAAAVRESGTVPIAVVSEAISLAALATPASWGAEIVVGEAQSFGVSVAYGGPYVGFIASTQEHMRRIPGRLVGKSVDKEGRAAYVLTLQAREQHIRRERATSNICTNQAHCALIATIYLALMGKTGLRDVAALNLKRSRELATAVSSVDGVDLKFDAPFFNEVVVDVHQPAADVLAQLQARRILGGVDLGRWYPELSTCILMNATELTTSGEIEALATALEKSFVSTPTFDRTESPLIFDLGAPGRANRYVEEGPALGTFLPKNVLRDDLPLPDNSELDVIRHFTKLSQRTFGIDLGFYPLGSCTMKYNPRINDAMATKREFAQLHPYTPDALAQGALQIMYELERSLASLFGMAAFSLNPSAGAHAELAALLIAKKYFKDKGETKRDKVIVPDTAHGTNPASAAMCGFKVISLPSDERGRVSVDEIRKVLGPDTAVCMMTNPNTLGLFEDHIYEIAAAVHEAGGLMYYDGANANAIMGNVRPGDMGFDLMHLNTHKTFTIPHGGGGAGHGPVGVAAHLVDYLPTPVVRARPSTPLRSAQDDNRAPSDKFEYSLDFDRPKSIGPMRSFWSNFAHAVRALAYIYANGAEGLQKVSQLAVLNANYVRVKVAEFFTTPYAEICRHEFVASAQDLKKETGVKALDIAKALLDHGMMAPTMYFPLIVPECLMIEPTETESKETLDQFIAVLREIVEEAKRNPEAIQAAPVTTVVGRVDETRAARQPNLKWEPA